MTKINLCLRLISFGISSTLLKFQDKYYEYEDEGLDTKGLAIGICESALLAYLVASFLLEVTNDQFKEVLWRGIYRDEGLLVLEGRRTVSEIRIWRDKFQEKVDKIAENNYLQFTCDTWNPGGHFSRTETKITSMITNKVFPFLDLELFWDNSVKLEFQVHLKKTNCSSI